MNYLKASGRPRELLEMMASPGQPPHRRVYREGFEHYFERMPVIDATRTDQSAEVALTASVLDELCRDVQRNLDALNVPRMPKGEFGRLILGVEEPKMKDGELSPGTEIVMAIWGEGFGSPTHGHAPGYIHEALVDGTFDVYIYAQNGRAEDRVAMLDRVIRQNTPGTFYSEFVRDTGQEKRSSVIHNFTASEHSISIHYLPEHIRDGNANRFTSLGTHLNGTFQVDAGDVQRVTPQMAMTSSVGDVYLVRSPAVAQHGDHYIVVIGGLVEKPHGLRPNDIVIPGPADSPLRAHEPDELVLLRLKPLARQGFFEHYEIDADIRAGGTGILPPEERFV